MMPRKPECWRTFSHSWNTLKISVIRCLGTAGRNKRVKLRALIEMGEWERMGTEQRTGLKLSQLAKIPQKSFKKLAETISRQGDSSTEQKAGFRSLRRVKFISPASEKILSGSCPQMFPIFPVKSRICAKKSQNYFVQRLLAVVTIAVSRWKQAAGWISKGSGICFYWTNCAVPCMFHILFLRCFLK